MLVRSTVHSWLTVSLDSCTKFRRDAPVGCCARAVFIIAIIPVDEFTFVTRNPQLNLVSVAGFAFAYFLEVSDNVSIGKLHFFMAMIGFAGVLPVSLPFQVQLIPQLQLAAVCHIRVSD